MKKREDGILSVEASIVLTLTVLFMLFLFGFARVYAAHSAVSHAVMQASDATSIESFLREAVYHGNAEAVAELANRFGQTNEISEESFMSLRSANVEYIARDKFIHALGQTEAEADSKLRSLGVKDGISGVNFAGTKFDITNNNITVFVTYKVKLEFPCLGFEEIELTKRARTMAFGGIRFTVEAVSSNNEHGSASGGGLFEFGEQALLVAEPAYGYKFVSWSNGCTDAEMELTVNDSGTYIARFEPDGFGINAICDGGGTVSGGGTYAYLSSAQVHATPSEGYSFSHWNIKNHKDGSFYSVNTPSVTLTVDQSKTAYAVFTANSYTISVETENMDANMASIVYNGSIYRSITLPYGQSFKLSTPEISGVDFLGWRRKNEPYKICTASEFGMTVPAENTTYVAVYDVRPSVKIVGGTTGGNSTTLSVQTVPPGLTVSWVSSDPSCVTVNNGVVTAVGASSAYWKNTEKSATITATILYKGVTYSDSVTVSADKSIEMVSYCGRDSAKRRHYFSSLNEAKNYADYGWATSGTWNRTESVTWTEILNCGAEGRTVGGRGSLNPTSINSSDNGKLNYNMSLFNKWQKTLNNSRPVQNGCNHSSDTGYLIRYGTGNRVDYYMFFIKECHAPKEGGGYYDYYIKAIDYSE